MLSVGDNFVNDIAPAIEVGAATAYLDPFGVGPTGVAGYEAGRLEDLLAGLEGWVAERAANADADADPAAASARNGSESSEKGN